MAAKVALVTGAGSGYRTRVRTGADERRLDMVLAGRRKEPLDDVAKEGAALGRKTLCRARPICPTRVQIKALFAKVMEAFGRLDLLFNNAGIVRSRPCRSRICPFEKWQAVVATNLTGPFLCTQEAFKIMKAQNPRGGRIINNGSISAHTPRPFTRRLHRDQARHHRPDQIDRA